VTDGTPPPAPTLATLRSLLARYGSDRGDSAVAAVRAELGGAPDPGQVAHAARLRACLNQWTCRIPYPAPGHEDVLARSLAAWWADARDGLPPDGQRLAGLADAQLAAVSRAYAGLYQRPAAVTRAGGIRTLGPTATAKLLYFLRPQAVPPWDKAISAATGGGSDGPAFRQGPGDRPAYLGRPASSVARLIDECSTPRSRPASAQADLQLNAAGAGK
jgi:hypothetical protein